MHPSPLPNTFVLLSAFSPKRLCPKSFQSAPELFSVSPIFLCLPVVAWPWAQSAEGVQLNILSGPEPVLLIARSTSSAALVLKAFQMRWDLAYFELHSFELTGLACRTAGHRMAALMLLSY